MSIASPELCSFNKPQGITTANGYTGFSYDANHNRVTKTTPTSTTAYIGKIFERTVMNGVTKDVSHIYAGSKLVASIEDVSGITSTKYMHGDHLGSISVITDEMGAVVERLRFDVFGAPVDPNTGAAINTDSANTTRGYTGHEMDASTGLINMNARLYDPVLGRFISADTVVPEPGNMQAFNRYSYVVNNPLMYTDPTGHFWHIVIGAIVGAVSAAINGGDFGDIFMGAVIGAFAAGFGNMAAGAAFGAAGGSTASAAAVAASPGSAFVAAGVAGGAVGGAIVGVYSTRTGGNLGKNIMNGVFFGAVAGAITGGMMGYLEVNDVIAAMTGSFTSGTMRGGIDDGLIAMAYAAGASLVSYEFWGRNTQLRINRWCIRQ